MITFHNTLVGGQFISIYDDTEVSSTFHVCSFLCEDDTYVLFQAISTRGFDDGFYLIPSDYIYRVDINDGYTKRIEQLFKLQNQSLCEDFCVTESNLLIQLLCYAKQQQLVTSLFLENEDNVTGWILDVDIDNGHVCMEKLTDDGQKDGISCINIENIEKIICNSGVERCIEMLTRGSSTEDGSVVSSQENQINPN